MRLRALAVSTATLIGTAALAPALATAAGGNTLYVNSASTACSDTGSGTLSAPFCTIQAAANIANPGDVIDVEPGSYAPTTITRSGTAAAPITITGATGRPAIGNNPTAAGDLTLSGVSYVNVENLVAAASVNADIAVDGGSDDVISHVTFAISSSATADALHITGGASAVTVVDSDFNKPVLIDGGATGTVFTTNLTAAPVEVTGATNTAITSNTLYACGSAVSVTNSSTGTSIENNVVNNVVSTTAVSSCNAAQAYGIEVDASSVTGTTSDYNDVNAAGGTADYDWNGTAYATQSAFTSATTQGAHDVDGAGAISVVEKSPIINSANSDAIGEQATDYRGDARYLDPLVTPTGAGTYDYYDRGADQFQDPLALVSPSYSIPVPKAPVGVVIDLSASTADSWGDTDLTYTYSISPSANVTLTQPSTSSGTAAVSFSQPGSYTISIYVQSPQTGTFERYMGSGTVQVVPVTPLTANFTAVRTIQKGVEVTDASTDDWTVTSVSYDFGDGTGAVAGNIGSYTNYTYAKPGTYQITETVEDNRGNKATTTRSLTTMEVLPGSLVTWSSLPETVGEGPGLTTATASGVAKSAIAAMPDGSSQLVAVTANGQLEHDIQFADGTWQGWRTLSQPGITVTDAGIAGMPNGSAQIVEMLSNGTILHNVRNANGSWQKSWGSPAGSTGIAQASIAALPNGSAQLVAVTTNGVLEHNIRFANGSWQGWRTLSQPGVTVKDASIAGLPDGSAQIVEVTPAGVMKHNIRFANGSWQKSWGIVTANVGLGPVSLAQVSIAGLSNGSSLMLATSSSGDPIVVERYADGQWSGWSTTDESSTGTVSDVAVAGTPSGWVDVSVVTAG